MRAPTFVNRMKKLLGNHESLPEGSIWGDGNRVDGLRPCGNFSSLCVEGPIPVRFEHGDKASVVVRGDSNLLNLVETECVDETLNIRMQRDIDIYVGKLECICRSPQLERARVTGGAEVTLRGLHSENVYLAVIGSGSIVAEGQCLDLLVDVYSQGRVDCSAVRAETGNLMADGSSQIRAHVTGYCGCHALQDSEISVSGNPEPLNSPSAGEGKVRYL